MANAGHASYIQYALEDSGYATAGSPCVAVFGLGQTVNITSRNNMERVWGLGARNATANVPKRFEGNASIDFVASSPWFWRLTLGSAIDTATGSVHTFNQSDSLPSFTIENGMNLGTDICRQLRGTYVNSMTMTASVNELVRVKLECPFANETANATIDSTPLTVSEDGLSFAYGTLTYGGSTVANIQSFELTVNNNNEQIFGLGSRVATAVVPKQREYGMRMTIAVDDPVLLHRFYGATTGPSDTIASKDLKLTFTNSAGTQPSSMVVALGSVFLDEDTITQNPNEVIKEDVSGWALYCGSVVAIDTTSAPHA